MIAGEFTGSAIERVVFGKPAAQAIVIEAQRRGATRVCLIVSEHLRRQTDEIEKVEAALGERHAGTFSGIPAHTPRSAVLRATKFVREAGADLLVAVGGGSVIDLTKVVPVCLENDVRTIKDFGRIRMRVHPEGGFDNPGFTPPRLRIINVPITLSAAEFTAIAGVTEEATREKQGYTHRLMAAAAVVLDPAITLHTPQWLWLSTGIRAVDHCAETLASLSSNPICDGSAATGLRLLRSGLPRVRRDPANLDARLECQMGAWQAMFALSAGVPMGLSHAIGHVLGGTCNVPHGYTSCVMLPYVMAWNAAVNRDRQALISACFDAPGRSASELLDEFIRNLGLPRTLYEVGVSEDHFTAVAQHTLDDVFGRTNPRPIRSAEDVLPVLRAALGVRAAVDSSKVPALSETQADIP